MQLMGRCHTLGGSREFAVYIGALSLFPCLYHRIVTACLTMLIKYVILDMVNEEMLTICWLFPHHAKGRHCLT